MKLIKCKIAALYLPTLLYIAARFSEKMIEVLYKSKPNKRKRKEKQKSIRIRIAELVAHFEHRRKVVFRVAHT